MAEINTPAAAGSKAGGRRGKKLSTRVDLTPMVDLGFLLITFFVFTTSMSKPKAMKMNMPAEGGEMDVKESGSLTIIPLAKDRVFFYHGSLENAMTSGRYGTVGYSFADGIGQVIRTKQLSLDQQTNISRKDMMVIVKPTIDAHYKNVVDIMDEMTINEVKSYALVDLSIAELEMLKTKNVH